MRIGLYQGTSVVSWAIRFITRSCYSHAAFVFDEPACAAADRMRDEGVVFKRLHFYHPGAVVEAWKGGVRNAMHIGSLHKRGTVVDLFQMERPGLTATQEEALVLFCDDIIGWPYGFHNVLRFITKQPGRDDGSYFCSEAVFEGFRKAGATLLKNKKDWEVPPDWLQMPTCLRFCYSQKTK